ncbi:hypothetical protein ACFE04_022705 [Oxalis oulophora]
MNLSNWSFKRSTRTLKEQVEFEKRDYAQTSIQFDSHQIRQSLLFLVHNDFPVLEVAGMGWYVTIDENHGKKLFYYFIESERNPSKNPVVLWLNGGPGCSSFDGFVYEHGPFNFEAAKVKGSLPTLHLNPYSSSKVSNILYLDSPAGVGFSYSKNKTDYITGDTKTASDSHIFLLKWFELYSEFLSNPFFISGESYAEIYVPTISYEVMTGLDAGTKPVINFKEDDEDDDDDAATEKARRFDDRKDDNPRDAGNSKLTTFG